ncbi:MAG TPA: methyltransferase domain-containing protein [Ktedonobacteraceae bacterium]|nr:methyltransferase domain-containing protein [Ktedonobacteraceae bacterium]
MPSISFDRVAHAYDETRGYPPGIDQHIAKAIVDTVNATSETTFMEVGVGTGRIAFPLASLGQTYTGVDISENMVKQLRSKLLQNGWQEYQQAWGSLPDEDSASAHAVSRYRNGAKSASMRLVLSDMTALPFHDASFDVVIAVHVFQLVDGWQQALLEVMRVIRPGGVFLHCWDEFVNVEVWPVGETWGKIVRELGGDIKRPGAEERSDVTAWLKEHGLQPQEIPVVQWEVIQTPREALDQVTRRLWSSTWVVPDDIFAESVVRLESWAKDYFGTDIDRQFKGTRQFVICKTEV